MVLWISVGVCGYNSEARRESHYLGVNAHLLDAQAFLVHVTQVKHGLGAVLLL